jgi:uncharacterized protein (TIGR03437 family)
MTLRLVSLACLLFSSQAFAQAPSFSAPVKLTAQQAPLAITAADFNKDGFQDLAIANAQTSTISIFLGNGKGQFSSAPVVALPQGCQAGYLTTGNFTGAASPDILAVCPLGELVVLPNTGNGTFGAAITTSLPLGAWVGNLLLGSIHPAIADFNGDGHLDIAIPVFDQTALLGAYYTLLGKGDGSFQAANPLGPTNIVPVSVAAGDFNGDKKIDLVTAQYDMSGNFSLQFYAGNGDGTFASPRPYSLPTAAGSILLVADVNGDGKPDVVIAGSSLATNLNALVSGYLNQQSSSQGAAEVTVMLGDGAGGFNKVFDTVESSYVTGAALADVLGTGKLDLIETVIQGNFLSGAAPTGAVTVRLGNGDGTFGNAVALNLPSTTIPTDVTTADFNGDGFADIAIASLPSQGVSINLSSFSSGLIGILQQVLSQLPIGNGEVLLNAATAVVPPVLTFTDTNSASFAAGPVAKGSIVTAFGTNIAGTTDSVTSIPWPANLGGDTISIKDSTGATTAALLAFVSPGQINFEIPDSVAAGAAAVTIQSGATAFTATQQIVAVAPGIFASNGMAAGSSIQVVNGAQQVTPLILNGALAPIDVAGGQTYLVLYGTGIHNHANPVAANIGTAQVTAAYAGPQGYYPGLDQINIQLPASLAGSGVLSVSLAVDGQTSNSVKIQIE